MLQWIHVSVSRILFVFPTLELHSLYDHNAREGRRCVHAPPTDTTVSSPINHGFTVQITGRARSRNGASDMQHDIKSKGRILYYAQSFVGKHAIRVFFGLYVHALQCNWFDGKFMLKAACWHLLDCLKTGGEQDARGRSCYAVHFHVSVNISILKWKQIWLL